jgi:hypothetical protein
MASRESQGLQVALILFVMVTVVLAVTTYVYFRKSEEKIKEAATAEKNARDSERLVSGYQFENQLLRHVLGYERRTEAELAKIRQALETDQEMVDMWTSYQNDMTKYGTGLPQDDLSYQNLPERLVTTIRTLNSDVSDANDLVNKLTSEREAIRVAEQSRATKAIAARDAATTDYTAEQRTFVTSQAAIADSRAQIEAQLRQRGTELSRLAGDMAEEKESRDKIISQMQQQLDAMRAQQLAERETTYETHDGKVTWVNQRSRIVWINLGSADGLKRQMTFSVYDREETGITTGKVKGRVEVTRVMEPHLAEARIVEDLVTDPILPEDNIYSPTFKKGQKTRFALVGLLDINGDGKSDQVKVKNIITMNGGVVDAELLEDGVIAGKMSLETKYLVKGERPTDKSNQKMLDGYSRMIDEATSLGIEPLSLDVLLDRMGYHEDRRTVSLTSGGSGGSGDGQRQSDTFRPRIDR